MKNLARDLYEAVETIEAEIDDLSKNRACASSVENLTFVKIHVEQVADKLNEMADMNAILLQCLNGKCWCCKSSIGVKTGRGAVYICNHLIRRTFVDQSKPCEGWEFDPKVLPKEGEEQK